MNWVERCCPEAVAECLRMFLVHFGRKGGKKRKSEAGGIEELEEEEFQFAPSKGLKQDHKPAVQKKEEARQEEPEEGLNFKMNLRQGEQEETSKLYEEEPQGLSTFNFKLNLQPYDPYYPVIESKTKDLQGLFASPTKNILTRVAKSCVSIEEIQTLSGFKMILNYRLPCSYAFFKRVNRSYEAVSALNSVISANRIVETVHANLTINHLSFRKFMLLEPRFFNYLKYENSTQNCHWEVCTSVKGRPETEPTEKECELTSISCFEERRGERGREELAAHTFLEVDLKSNLRASKVVLRVYQQLASYLDSLFDYVAEHYQEQQV